MASIINDRTRSKDAFGWSFFFPVSFLLVQYGYGFGTPMLTYCLLFAGYCVIRYQELPVFKPLSIYTLWYVIILLSTVLYFGHSADRAYWMHLIQILVCGYCVAIIAKHLNIDSLYRCWKVLGLIVCVVVFYQFFQIYVLHQTILPIRLMPVSSESLRLNENWTNPSYRPVAFFTEPSMVVSFLAPVLLFAQQKKDLLVAAIVSIAILFSGSTSGIVALGVLWGLFIFNYKLSRSSKILIILLFVVAVFAFLNLPYFRDSLEKINYELSGESSNMNTRMLRGWFIYAVLDTRSQLLGISDYDIASFIYGNASEFTWQTGYEDNFYLNTAQRIFIQTGAVGAVLYVWMLIRLWKSTDKIVHPYLAFVIVSMFFGSEFYISGLFVMQFIVLLAYLKPSKEQ